MRAKLAADEERYEGDPANYRSKLKKLEKSKAKYEKEMADWKAAEAALLELKLKAARSARLARLRIALEVDRTEGGRSRGDGRGGLESACGGTG